MGCDIHLIAERRGEDGIWRRIAGSDGWYEDRNYATFAILADVRNRHGHEPIAEPRGLPDMAPLAEDDPWLGDHSFSWLSLPELLAFDWERTVQRTGVVVAPPDRNPHEWAAMIQKYATDDAEFPWHLCPMVYGPDYLDPRGRLIAWPESYAATAERFIRFVVLRACRHADGDFASVRIVFGFDS